MKEKDSIIPNMLLDEDMLSDLQKMLDEQLSLPEEERDYDAIKEITAAIVEIADDQAPQIPDAETIIGKAAERNRKKIGHLRRWAAAVSACIAVVIGLNAYTLATYGENIIDTILKKTRNGFTVDIGRMPHNDETDMPQTSTSAPPSPQTSTPPPPHTSVPPHSHTSASGEVSWTTTFTEAQMTSESAAVSTTSQNLVTPDNMVEYISDSMISYCSQNGMDVIYVPTKLPDEMAFNGFFELEEAHYEPMEDSEDFSFTFTNGNEQQFRITLEKYKDESGLPEVLIPSDNSDYIDGERNGTHVYAFPNRNMVTAIFVHDNVLYTINGYNISADAVMELAFSFRPSNSDIK